MLTLNESLADNVLSRVNCHNKCKVVQSYLHHVFRGVAPAHWLEHKERRGAALLEGQISSSSRTKLHKVNYYNLRDEFFSSLQAVTCMCVISMYYNFLVWYKFSWGSDCTVESLDRGYEVFASFVRLVS